MSHQMAFRIQPRHPYSRYMASETRPRGQVHGERDQEEQVDPGAEQLPPQELPVGLTKHAYAAAFGMLAILAAVSWSEMLPLESCRSTSLSQMPAITYVAPAPPAPDDRTAEGRPMFPLFNPIFST